MSAFYIGQRVRIVRTDKCPEALQREATVIGSLREALLKDGHTYFGYEISVDGIGRFSPRGNWYCFPAEYLEPIIPPGLESLAEINALYEPEPVSA